MNLTDLNTFVLVAELGTMSAAARRLGVPKSTVSRRVSRLEDALGHALLLRTPRTVALTEHGEILQRRTSRSLQELHAAAEAISEVDTEPTGTLRVTTTPSFGQSKTVVSCLTSYGIRYPKTTVDLELTNRVVNLVDEGIDVGLRLHTADLPGSPTLMSRRLFRYSRALYASPHYVREMGEPDSPRDLQSHRLAAHSRVDAGLVQWKRCGKPWGKPRALPTPKWLVNDSTALERFALSGAALAVLPEMEAHEWVRDGRLVRVLPDYEQQSALVSLVWPASRYLAPRVRAFIDHAVALFKSEHA